MLVVNQGSPQEVTHIGHPTTWVNSNISLGTGLLLGRIQHTVKLVFQDGRQKRIKGSPAGIGKGYWGGFVPGTTVTVIDSYKDASQSVRCYMNDYARLSTTKKIKGSTLHPGSRGGGWWFSRSPQQRYRCCKEVHREHDFSVNW